MARPPGEPRRPRGALPLTARLRVWAAWGVLAALGAAAAIGAPWWNRAAAQAPACTFVLGFATLRDLIGAATVGDCLEDQRFAANGNAEQRTTGGLLVWRKADNWTAFTDGYQTWLNGPQGLQRRLNNERFSWEGERTTSAPAATATPPPKTIGSGR